MSITRLLDEATHKQLADDMGCQGFVDTVAAIKHLAYLVRSGRRFSPQDVMAVLGDANLNTDGVSAALDDLARRRILESYPKDGTVAYYMERGARIEYGESIGCKSRVSGWFFSASPPASA